MTRPTIGSPQETKAALNLADSQENRYALNRREPSAFDPAQFEKPILRVSIKSGVIEDNRDSIGMDVEKEKDVDQAQRELIRKLYLHGCSADYIAHKLGIDRGLVGKVIGGMKRREGKSTPPQSDSPMQASEEAPPEIAASVGDESSGPEMPIEEQGVRESAPTAEVLPACDGTLKEFSCGITIDDEIVFWEKQADACQTAAKNLFGEAERAIKTRNILHNIKDTYEPSTADEMARAVSAVAKRSKSA